MVQLFVSDLHLEESRPEITRAFFRLLDKLQNKFSELYLLGDIFEVWLGDDTPSPVADQLSQRLASLSEHGIRIFLMHGNRDFLLGEAFASRCKASLIHEPYLLQVAGKQAVLLHGDALCTQDIEYQAFRKLVRDPRWQADFLAKPLNERIAIGRQLRDKSQESAKEKSEYLMDVTPNEVESMMLDLSVELMIHGHTHRPAVHKLTLDNKPCTRMVLGDWYTQGWYILADQQRVELTPLPFTD